MVCRHWVSISQIPASDWFRIVYGLSGTCQMLPPSRWMPHILFFLPPLLHFALFFLHERSLFVSPLFHGEDLLSWSRCDAGNGHSCLYLWRVMGLQPTPDLPNLGCWSLKENLQMNAWTNATCDCNVCHIFYSLAGIVAECCGVIVLYLVVVVVLGCSISKSVSNNLTYWFWFMWFIHRRFV